MVINITDTALKELRELVLEEGIYPRIDADISGAAVWLSNVELFLMNRVEMIQL